MALSHRTAPQSARREAVEAAVLGATERLLEQGHAFGELGVERIAREAGISRPAFYFHFRDKRDLLTRLTAEVSTLLYAEAERWWTGDLGDDAVLRTALAQVAALYEEHAAVLRAVVGAAAVDEQVAAFWRELVGRFVAATRARLQEGGAAPEQANATAFALTWMTERALYERLVDPAAVDATALVDALAAIWRGSVGS